MKEKLAKLIDVKSIVTILLTICFIYLAVNKIIGGSEYLTIFTMIVSFYFGTQLSKPTKTEQ